MSAPRVVVWMWMDARSSAFSPFSLHRAQHGRHRLVRQGLGREGLVAAAADHRRLRAQAVEQDLRLQLHIVDDVLEALLALDDLDRTLVTLGGHLRRQHAGLRGQRVGGVLHVRQVTGYDAAQREVAAAADARGRHQLVDAQPVHATGHERAHELCQRRMVPAHLAHAGEAGQAPPEFQLIGDHDADDGLATVASAGLGRRQRAEDDVRRVAGILLPEDVVVVQRADQQAVHQRCVRGVRLLAGADQRGLGRTALPADEPVHGGHVRVAHGGQGAAHRVQQEALGFLHVVGGQVVIAQAYGVLGHAARQAGAGGGAHGAPCVVRVHGNQGTRLAGQCG
jgi:hypothetical protein